MKTMKWLILYMYIWTAFCWAYKISPVVNKPRLLTINPSRFSFVWLLQKTQNRHRTEQTHMFTKVNISANIWMLCSWAQNEVYCFNELYTLFSCTKGPFDWRLYSMSQFSRYQLRRTSMEKQLGNTICNHSDTFSNSSHERKHLSMVSLYLIKYFR